MPTRFSDRALAEWLSDQDLVVRFVVPGVPVPKARARIVRGRAYTPERTRAAEETIGWHARQQYAGPPQAGPLELFVNATMAIPKSWSKNKRAAAIADQIRPTTRCDWDNLGKLVSDALKGIICRDDAQIVKATVTKYYGAFPETAIEVWRWTPEKEASDGRSDAKRPV